MLSPPESENLIMNFESLPMRSPIGLGATVLYVDPEKWQVNLVGNTALKTVLPCVPTSSFVYSSGDRFRLALPDSRQDIEFSLHHDLAAGFSLRSTPEWKDWALEALGEGATWAEGWSRVGFDKHGLEAAIGLPTASWLNSLGRVEGLGYSILSVAAIGVGRPTHEHPLSSRGDTEWASSAGRHRAA
jgi:hypothetical protein